METKLIQLMEAGHVSPTTSIFGENEHRTAINILIVDDDPAILKKLENMLELLKHDIAHLADISIQKAHNGREAIKQLSDGQANGWLADIIFSDINMPIIGGYELCKRVRTNPELEELRQCLFVFITGELVDSDTGKAADKELKAVRLGADEVISKHISDELLYLHAQRAVIKQLQLKAERSKSQLLEESIYHYVNRSLVQKILRQGFIDQEYYDAFLGVVFGDISDSSHIAQVLSPLETGLVFNGVFTIVHELVERYGGHYNKSIGDGFLVHFGGPLDEKLGSSEKAPEIAVRIMDLCVDIQRSLEHFNTFSYVSADPDNQQEIEKAYRVLRTMQEAGTHMPILLRLGACQGQVTIGDFGPRAFRQYDIVGDLVNMASRLQSTCAPRGIRLHQSVCEHLFEHIKGYVQDFRERTAGHYHEAANEDIFKFKMVTAKGFAQKLPTYALEPLYDLPEIVQHELRTLLSNGTSSIPRILDRIRLYRGNKFVLDAIDALFIGQRIKIRRGELFQLLNPAAYAAIQADPAALAKKERLSLFGLPKYIGKQQDAIELIGEGLIEEDAAPPAPRSGYAARVAHELASFQKRFEIRKQKKDAEFELYEQLIPQVFIHIRESLQEYFDARSTS